MSQEEKKENAGTTLKDVSKNIAGYISRNDIENAVSGVREAFQLFPNAQK